MAENKVNEEELTNQHDGSENLADSTAGSEVSEENKKAEEEEAGEESQETEVSNQEEIDPVAAAKQEAGEMKEKYLRLYAEFENFRRRTSKERIELISTANAGLLKSLLPVLDDFERAIASFENVKEEGVDSMKEGINLVYAKFLRTLESEGLKAMEAKGETFNPDFHDSVVQFPAENEEQKGKVIEVLEKGYYLNDKVVRFAKVVVGV